MQFRGHSPRTIFTGAPTLPQPLSHGAERRDSSPFRGAEGWAEVCGVCASVYHDADTRVSLTPVRGGVPDAPRSRNCRAALGAPARLDHSHPRHPRRARLRPPPNVCNFAGTARAPFHTGAPTFSVHRRRAGVEARPYGALRRFRRGTHVVARSAGAAAQNKIPRGGGEFSLLQTRARPRASHLAAASSSGASAHMTLSQASSAPQPLAEASQERIHSPSPQP